MCAVRSDRFRGIEITRLFPLARDSPNPVRPAHLSIHDRETERSNGRADIAVSFLRQATSVPLRTLHLQMKKLLLAAVALAVIAVIAFIAYLLWPKPEIQDAAMKLGLKREDFPELRADVFQGMDNGITLSPDAIAGRNSWNLWAAGSQGFIEWLATQGYGMSDTLRMLDSRKRSNRFEDLGLINEPGFKQAEKPDRWGVWLDVPEDGSSQGRIDRMVAEEGINERVYGRSTGVLGLRLFPNPKFNKEAQAKWDPERFYDLDDDYSMNPDLVRPYMVGMTCGVCHIAPHPLHPPENPNEPEWENLVSGLGNQYIKEGRVFATNLRPPKAGEPSSFLWEMINSQPPGTSDTSRMATDHINNPNAINAIFHLSERLRVARDDPNANETMSEATQRLTPDDPNPRFVPHVLKDGADSVGVPGATIRVYVNIGLFSEYWLTCHKPLLGIRHQQPFEIEKAQKNSVYWQATEDRLKNIATFLSSLRPMPLAEAKWRDRDGKERSGAEWITNDQNVMRQGKLVFAENCAQCHSSRRPPNGIDPESDAAIDWFREDVLKDDFLANNFLSEDRRHSIGRLQTNAGRALATNAKRGRIWDNFSSETYKTQPVATETIQVYNPITRKDNDYTFDLKKKKINHSLGYYRTPSLIAIWTSAPFLHNNALGIYTGDPSVEGRMTAFEDAAEKLLWPEKRDGVNSIWRTQHVSAIEIPVVQLPKIVQAKVRLKQFKSELLGRGKYGQDYIRIGPIPKGMPINLLANLDLSLGGFEDAVKAVKILELAVDIKEALLHAKLHNMDADETAAYLEEKLLPELLEHSKCPDFVNDRGHYFGTNLPDDDKRALIEFMKTF